MTVPAITSIEPKSGPLAGGTVVSIIGTDMHTATAVTFGTTAATDFASISATHAVATAPAGTGLVHVTLATAGGTSTATAADYFQYSDGLFTVAEARAFDRGQLASSGDYPTADITAKEAEIREWLSEACKVDFVPTTHALEYHSGDGTQSLLLDWPRVTAVSAIWTRSDSVWTAFTADELADVQIDPGETGVLFREGAAWPAGVNNVRVTYTAGYATVPYLIKRAALLICSFEMPQTNMPYAAESYDSGGISVSYARGDGYKGNWHSVPEVQKAINMYNRSLPGIA